MAKAKISERGGRRSALTKLLTEVNEYVQGDSCTVFELQMYLNRLTDSRDRIENLNDIIQSQLNDEALEEDVVASLQYDEKAALAISNLKAIIASLSAPPLAHTEAVGPSFTQQPNSPVSGERTNDGPRHPDLPKLSMVKFAGSALQWEEFWDDFSGTVHERDDLNQVSKFKYLKTCLTGDALRLAEGFRLTAANYEQVVQALKERYGDKDVAVFAHFEALLDIPKANYQVEQLRATYDKCEAHIRSLVALEQSEETFGKVYVPILLKKLPTRVQEEMYRKNGSNKWTLQALRTLLKEEIDAREKAEMSFRNQKDGSGTNKWQNNRQGGGNEFSGGNQAQRFQKQKFQGRTSTASALVFSASKKKGKPVTQPKTTPCAFCDGPHYSGHCKSVKDAASRQGKVREKSLCFACLSPDHPIRDCKLKDRHCTFCGKTGHHNSLCNKELGKNETAAIANSGLNPQAPDFRPQQEENTLSVNTLGIRAVMETAVVVAEGEHGREKTRCLFDNGSTRSYISRRKAEQLGGRYVRSETLSVARFNENQRKSITRDIVAIDLYELSGRKKTIEVCVVNFISAPIQLYPLEVEDTALWSRICLAEPLVHANTMVDVEILIGLDYYHEFIGDHKIRCNNGLVFLESTLGYVASGKMPGQDDNTSHEVLFISAVPDSVQQYTPFELEKFWNIEEIGIKDDPKTTDDEMALQKFNETVKFENKRYQVCWPWKTEKPDLPTNYSLALGRLKSLCKRLQADPELLKQYHEIIMDQLKKGITEKVPPVPDGIVHYIPHHAVVKPDRATTKVRVVYDASSKSNKAGLSVNDCLYRGPVIMKDLVGLLLRFRLHRTAIVSDVEKAFHQIALQPDQRDVARFLWLKNPDKPPTADNITSYRFSRVAFGYVSSSFLLGACILHLLHKTRTAVARSIENGLYIDNVLHGTKTAAEALEYFNEAVAVFRKASMNLREWYSNSQEFMENLPVEQRGVSSSPKVLGLKWDTSEDIWRCTVGNSLSAEIRTKRQLLQALASLYDPCGFFTPATIKAKILMQDLWRDGVNWDSPLPSEILSRWDACRIDLQLIPTVKIPRQLGSDIFAAGSCLQLHCFCDASEKAYSASLYIRVQTGADSTVDLLASKSRVSPLKQKLTVPKLELIAILIGCRLLNFVRSELQLQISSSVVWSDSECALQWVKQKEHKAVFIRNRVTEIRQTAEVSFRYVATSQNPADLPTRGVSTAELAHSELWWHGPEWVRLPPDKWPIHKLPPYMVTETESCENDQEPTEADQQAVCLVETQAEPRQKLIDVDRCSTLLKLHRVTALVVKFIKLLRKEATSPMLTPTDLADAEHYWLKQVQSESFEELISARQPSKAWIRFKQQLAVFKDDQGILRCQGRLANVATFEENNPILLPKNNPYTRLVIEECHRRVYHSKTKHTLTKVREKYWVVHGREQVKKVLKECEICLRFHCKAFLAPMPPDLPEFRVRMARPFSRVGLDYIGPLFVSDNVEKVWICLYTCATTRGIYLDVVEALATADFLLCLRRFSATYGIPDMIVSDNAQQLHAGDRLIARLFREAEVRNFCTNKGIKWKFITELAPWMGGFYERLVQPVKSALKKSLGRRCVNLTELRTLVMEIASVVNTRPLVYSESDVGDQPLTPAHFLMKAPSQWPSLPTEDEYLPKKESSLILQWKRIQSVLDAFWLAWRKQYLLSLREKWQSRGQKGVNEQPKVGTVVQIADARPRGLWRLGRITKLLPSNDGKVRSVEVRLGNGNCIRRAIAQLHPIEFSPDDPPTPGDRSEEHGQVLPQTTSPVQLRTREKRKAAVKAEKALRKMAESEEQSEE